MKEISLILFFAWFLKLPLFSQEIIITYKIDRQDNHPTEKYYWLVKLNDNKLYPVYFEYESFSKDNLDRCLEGKEIDIFVSTSGTNWDFSESFLQILAQINDEIDKNKKMFIKARSRMGKDRTKYKVYYSIVDVNFCYCQIASRSGKFINYQGYIFLPISLKKDRTMIDEHKVEKHLKELNILLFQLENRI